MRYPTAEQIIELHDSVVTATGGSLGLREPGLLAAIVDKPLASFGGEDLYPTIYDKAAAIFEALCNYHVFVDGNKRTAITSLEYFLEHNGYIVTATASERESLCLRTAEGHPDLATIAAWIQSNSKSLRN